MGSRRMRSGISSVVALTKVPDRALSPVTSAHFVCEIVGWPSTDAAIVIGFWNERSLP